MAWKDKRNEIKTMLQQQGFGHKVDNTLIWTKQVGSGIDVRNIVIDIASEKICFWKGGDESTEDDEEGTLADLISEIESIMLLNGTETEKDTEQPVSKTEDTISHKYDTANESFLQIIDKYVGNDVLELFGDTGTGKSKICLEIAKQSLSEGKKVYYLDTERNLTDNDIADLKGCEYKYTPVLEEIDSMVQDLPAVDVVILDSIGFPVLTTYARLSLKQKGDALLKLIAIFGDLKTWAYKNNGIVIVTNQPESEFNKEKGHVLRPFGDKSQFAAKEIWKTELIDRSTKHTRISLRAFRSRSHGFRTEIADVMITNEGVKIK